MFRTVAVLVSVALSFCAVELGLRLLGGPGPGGHALGDAQRARRDSIWTGADDDVLIYRHRPNYRALTDRHGLLKVPGASEVVVPKHGFRIAVLGDSIAAGLDLPKGTRFPDRLPGLLNAEILNFSVNGYRSVQEARLLDVSAADFRPDLIVLQYCLNDAGNSMTPTVWFQKKARKPFGSRLLRLVTSVTDPKDSDYVPVFGPGYGKADYWLRLYEPDSASWRSVRRSFREIAAHGIPCVVVIFPLLLDGGWQAPRMRPYHEQVRRAAEAAGLSVIDLLERYMEHAVRDLQMAPGDIYHPNGHAHEIAAKAIAEWVASRRSPAAAD